MTGTTARTERTRTGMASVLKKPARSSKTKKESSQSTESTQPKKRRVSSQLVSQLKNASSSSATAKGRRKTGSKSSASSQQEKQAKKTEKDIWEGYDVEELPPLSDEQLASFRKITPEEHAKYANMQRLPRGRPQKAEKEKAKIVSMRFYETLLTASKKKAKAEGYDSWQKWARHALEVASGLKKEGERKSSQGSR